MTATGSLHLAVAGTQYVFRVVGKGKARESKIFHVLAESILKSDASISVTLDVQHCDYLDITFLGSIADVFRHFGSESESRFAIRGAPARCAELFGPTRLDSVLTILDTQGSADDAFQRVPIEECSTRSAAEHAVMCHRRLAEVPGPHQRTFARIADQMAQELDAR